MSAAWPFSVFSCFALLLAIEGTALAQTDGATAETQTASADAQAGSADGTAESAPLTEDELEVLVARIALYPDELVAVISAASLYPLQIVEAARFLDAYAKDSSLQPKDTWDGSIISLLNYPEIVKMMSDDLEWTQALGDAIAYQQQDVLIAIQQLRDQAVADGVIKSDDKINVVQEGDNIVIQPTNTETVYVPQYEPQMLYDPGYPPAPIAYYPNPYPNYYYPTATFFTGFVTGAIWGAVVDWNDWGVWGGHWNGNDVNIDIGCNNCFNNRNFNGDINWKDVDWKNVDRNKINIDRNQFNKIDKSQIKNNIRRDIERNPDNSIRNKASNIKKERPSTLPGGAGNRKDVRASTLEGLKNPQARPDRPRPDGRPTARPDGPRPDTRPAARPDRPQVAKPAARPAQKVDRPKVSSKPQAKPAQVKRSAPPKAGAKIDNRPKKASALGKPSKGKMTKVNAKRGHASGPKKIKKGGGGGHRGGGRRR
jgi:Protein of unknown function (DUF3300)